jgi:hypothetical protein
MSPRLTTAALALAMGLAACSGSIQRGSDEGGPDDPGVVAGSTGKDPVHGAKGGTAGTNMPPTMVDDPNSMTMLPPVGSHPLEPDRANAKCKTLAPGPAPARRLTRAEFDNTIKDLVGEDMKLAAAFPPEEVHASFDNDANTRSVSDLLAEGYSSAAEAVAKKVVAGLGGMLPCASAGGDETACLDKFLDGFGTRAWRRPLTGSERDDLKAIFTKGKTKTFADGIDAVVQVMLLSPQFLYRVETGVAIAGADYRRLSHWEMASRLSYLLVGSMPDAQLMAAAEAGKLGTRGEVATHAERLLQDPRATAMVVNFGEQWLQIRGLAEADKDPAAYPKFKDTFLESWRQETAGFLAEVWRTDPKLSTLLTAPWSVVNAELASLYGAPAPKGTGFEKVMMDPKQRAGVLTQGSVMAVQSDPDQTSPIHRGVWALEQMLCSPPPPPPQELNAMPPALNPKMTTRERVAAHRTNPSCAACHEIIDNVGMGFENYDALGAYRATENGKPVDAKGYLSGSDVETPFDGAVEMAQRMVVSKDVSSCMVSHWFHYGLGRDPTAQDACTNESLGKAFADSKGDLRQLLLALVQTDAFFFKGAVQ